LMVIIRHGVVYCLSDVICLMEETSERERSYVSCLLQTCGLSGPLMEYFFKKMLCYPEFFYDRITITQAVCLYKIERQFFCEALPGIDILHKRTTSSFPLFAPRPVIDITIHATDDS